jgi:TonB-dependent receptor
VSIDRTNGEGSRVTVRGFGSGYNLVTLNGRTMPTADVQTVGGDQDSDNSRGTSRSFDFSNIASEGVSTLEVFKTGRAAVPSGGIGATINVRTRRPLDGDAGLSGSIGVKGLYDTSVEKSLKDADKITPEISGLLNWVDDNETFGVTLFGSYQDRNFTTRSATSNDWNIRTYGDFINPANGFVRNDGRTQITGAPSSPSTLVAIPNDSRYHFSEGSRERINGQASFQFRPTETITLTADAIYAKNKAKEERSDQANWFNRPFDRVTFDGNQTVATAIFLQETLSGTKDMGFEQQYRANTDELQSFALNGTWQATDRITVSLDGHMSKATSKPGASNGASATLVAIGAPVIADHSVDYSGRIPVQAPTINDAAPRGNGNGRLDVGDLGSQVARTYAQRQTQDLDEIRGDIHWDLDDNGTALDFGANYRTSKMKQANTNTQQDLGSWGISNPRDVSAIAGNLVSEFCLACKFDHFDPQQTGPGLVAFRANAIELYDALSAFYAGRGNAVGITEQADNRVKEDIFSLYGQLTWKGELAGRRATMVAGVRYERTEVDAVSQIRVPTAIVWTADNDFRIDTSATNQPVSGKGKYNNLLPAFDFSVDLREDLVGRISFSRTISRPDYADLFAVVAPEAPNRPIANGAIPLGRSGNPDLNPLTSDNFDISLEWYFKPDSYISAGFFEKRVSNFVGVGTFNRNLFGLRDPSSGAAGTRSGLGKDLVASVGANQSDVNLFTATALIIQTGSVDAARQIFQANRLVGPGGALGDLNQGFVDSVLAAADISPNASDPLLNFQVSQPVNNKDAKIWGFEIAGTYFLGETGFGVTGAYTYVDGDVGFDAGADPGQDQFALVGLSDTANVTLIYEKYGISARVAFNWRDKFLSRLNRQGSRNPVFVEPFSTVDFNVSYDINDQLAVSFEGINIFEESLRTYARDSNELWFAQEIDSRYLVGLRYKF